MTVLLQKVTIIAAASPHHKLVKDILIVNGKITQIDNNIETDTDTVVSGNNLHVSVGWCDMFANFCEPGYEHKETLHTGAMAAAAGGFTDVMLIPNTLPIVDSKAQVEFLIQRAITLPINIHPIGAITKLAEGKALAEMYDMYASGAVAFSDGNRAIQHADILVKALQYAIPKKAVIIQIPVDNVLSMGGLINEGIESTKLGLPGLPAVAEEIMIARDIALLSYTHAALHITGVSTQQGLALIDAARQKGLQISCSVTPYHLLFCDEDLGSYDTNLKLNPPLRTRTDMLALQAALLQGKINCIASHHSPQSVDDKICEFEYAKNGMLTLQSLFGSIATIMHDLDKLINILTENNRAIFGLTIPTIEVGSEACLTLFEPDKIWVFAENDILSKSKNSAFVGKQLKGKVVGIFNKNKWVANQ